MPKYQSCLDEYTLDELRAQAETYREMHDIATRELGYTSILEALEATPKAPMVRMRSVNGGSAWVYVGDVHSFEDDGWTSISEAHDTENVIALIEGGGAS